MTNLTAKQRILQVAKLMIEEQGYINLNVNLLAERANVAIGTLYWHFKKGKLSITQELARSEILGTIDYLKDLKIDPKKPFLSFKPFILKYIDYHRKNKALLRAFEIEGLSDLEKTKEFEEIQHTEINKTMEIIIDVINKLNLNINIENIEPAIKKITMILDDLVHKQVLYNERYGTDDELSNVLITIFKSILLNS